jgi:TonB family protein
MNVAVSYQSGDPIYGLGASDFQITEGGVPQAISLFETSTSPKTPDSLSSYYVLGYYAHIQNFDGAFRKVGVSLEGIPAAKLGYRSGYYARGFDFVAAGLGAVSGSPAVPDSTAGNFRPATLTYKVDPAYSEEAREAKFQGWVVLDVEVGASGQVTSVGVARPLGLGLDEKAMEAVRQWRFRPAVKDGKPVAVKAEVQVDFRLL